MAIRQEWQAVADRLVLGYEVNSQVQSSLLTGQVGGWPVEVWVKQVRTTDTKYESRGVIEAELPEAVPRGLTLEGIERVGTAGDRGPMVLFTNGCRMPFIASRARGTWRNSGETGDPSRPCSLCTRSNRQSNYATGI